MISSFQTYNKQQSKLAQFKSKQQLVNVTVLELMLLLVMVRDISVMVVVDQRKLLMPFKKLSMMLN